MPEPSASVRTIEPFGFWPDCASALGGLGGDQGGPDPYYCFHTPYLEYQPGGLIFRMRLIGARATMGELALRVHAWRADGSIDAVLVGGMRIPLDDMEGDQEFAVRVTSLPGVIYAFFARYTQPSDLRIDDLILTAEELNDEDVHTYAAFDLEPTPFAPKNLQEPSHLTLIGEPNLRTPASQPCTPAQLRDSDVYDGLPADLRKIVADPFEQWKLAYVRQVLTTYGVTQPGAAGLVVGFETPSLLEALAGTGALIADAAHTQLRGVHDFLVDNASLEAAQNAIELSQQGLRKLTALRKGGLGVFLFRAKLGGRATADPTGLTDGAWIPGEQDIQRVALRMIGHGSDVAQIVWPSDRDSMEVVPFGLIVQR